MTQNDKRDAMLETIKWISSSKSINEWPEQHPDISSWQKELSLKAVDVPLTFAKC